MFRSKNIIICLFLIFILNSLPGQNYYGRTRSYPLPKTTMERLGENALKLAQEKLAKNRKDKQGLLLLNFANHLTPTNRDVLLIRGKLKFNVPFSAPKKVIDEKEFLLLLSQARDHINDSDTAINRHILAVLNQVIRSFNPKEEDAIIALMEFSDKGVEVDVDKLLAKRLNSVTDTKFDPSDSRYAISDIKKSITVPANTPWTDSWIKVTAGKMITVAAHGTWSMGDKADFPVCDPGGYATYDIKTLKRWSATSAIKQTYTTSKKAKRSGAPGCLLAKIGTKEYYIGKQMTFKAESSGILYFGPYEWGDYLDNYGSLTINVEISD
jgi:hypothetical protein